MCNSVKCCFLLFVFSSGAIGGKRGDAQGYRRLTINAGKQAGTLRSFQGVNGPPTPVMAGLPASLEQQYKDLHIDQVRTHDFMGPTDIDAKYDSKNGSLKWLLPDPVQRASVVRAGNSSTIFPNPDADPERPESYRFGPTDAVLTGVRKTGAEIYYRIGRSWGANEDPPADFDKFAAVVKHVAMHYNQGWDNGYHYNIRYWEFWNEPEGFWSGTPEQFYSLYGKTAVALKAVDPTLRVGGDAVAASHDNSPWREGFIDYCASQHLPLDFYSWHTYANVSSDPYDVVRLGREIRQLLDTHGFPKAESILSEWNLTPDFTILEAAELQGAHTAAYVGAVLTYLQDAQIDHAQFYRGDSAWMGLFDLNGGFFKPAYSFSAMGRLLGTPRRLSVSGIDTFGFTALAGGSSDGKTIQILISNFEKPLKYEPRPTPFPDEYREPAKPVLWERRPAMMLPNRTDIVYHDNEGYSLFVTNLPWGKSDFTVKRYRISAKQNLDLVEDVAEKGSSLELSRALPVDTVELIVLQRQ